MQNDEKDRRSNPVVARAPVAFAGAMVLLFCGACGKTGAPTPVHALRRSELTPAELKYGRAPKPDRNVTYQPNVVMVDEGPNAIRSAAPDGLTWTIDAGASHADQLAVGKIAFITGRCVGRVLSARRDGPNLVLVLGPVELIDIFRRLDVTVDHQPLNLTEAIHYPTPQLPGMHLPLEGDDVAPPAVANMAERHPRLRRSSMRHSPGGARLFVVQGAPAMPGIIPQPLKIELQTEKPLSNADGIGMEFSNDKSGMRVVAQVQLRLNQPYLEAHLSINNGSVDAKVILHNAAGLRIAFDSAVNQDFPGTVNWYSPAGSFNFPLSGSVPLSFDVRQDLYLNAEFQARSSAFSAGGDYNLNADIGLTYQHGKFNFVGPKGLSVRQSIMTNMSGISLKAARVGMVHQITLTAGLGGAGFTAGPRLSIGTRIDVRRGSDIGIVQCHGATLAMSIRGGVGWTIPTSIEKFVNLFLSLLNVSPIQDHGGIETDWRRLLFQQAQTGSVICGS